MRLLYFTLPLLLLQGCEDPYTVSVEMRPLGGAIERELRSESGFTRETASQIRATYDEWDQGAARQTFAADLPGEFGGHGFHHRYASDLGTASFYSERIEEAREPWDIVRRIDIGVERCADLLLPWLKHELATRPDLCASLSQHEVELRSWVKGKILEVALHAPNQLEDGLALFAHELMVAGFLGWSDIPIWAELQDGDEPVAALLDLVRRFLAQGREFSPSAPEFAFLSSPAALVAHWRSWIAAGGAREIADPPDGASTPAVAFQFLGDTIDLAIFKKSQRVTVTLRLGVEPLQTNGQYDAARGLLSWPGIDVLDSAPLPTHFYALWAEPDEMRQERLLGRVHLTGERLVEYVLWYEQLEPVARAHWKAKLDELVASPELETLPDSLVVDDHPELARGLQLLSE